jgi:cytochrome c1
MRFQVGKFTCELSRNGDGAMQAKWLPDTPRYLNKAERDQYQAGITAFLESVETRHQETRRDIAGGG